MSTKSTVRSNTRGIDAPVIRNMRSGWETLATSRGYRQAAAKWGRSYPALAEYADCDEIVAAALNGTDETKLHVFEALGHLAVVDRAAMRTILQALLPRIVALLDRSHHTGIDLEDRADQLMLIASEVVVSARPGTAGTNYDFRLWCNMRRTFVRWCDAHSRQVDSNRWQRPIEEYAAEMHTELQVDFDTSESHELAELCDWVAERARIDMNTARLVVLTRAGGVPLEAMLPDAPANTIRKKRRRAEQKLERSLVAA